MTRFTSQYFKHQLTRKIKAQRAFEELPYVFVYGTLKKGYSNNHILKTSTFLGKRTTEDKYFLGNVGFPYAFPSSMFFHNEETEPYLKKVEGELYKVDSPTTLSHLDSLEGEGFHYNRVKIQTSEGETCWIYTHSEKDSLDRVRFCTKTEGDNWLWP